MGIEPTSEGFADLSLTTWVPRQERQYSETGAPFQRAINGFSANVVRATVFAMIWQPNGFFRGGYR